MKAMLKDGFEIEIKEDRLGKWEFVEVCRDIDEGETGLIVDLARMILGRDGVKLLAEHLGGDPDTSDMVDALHELFDSVNSLKNSEPSPA